MQRCLQLAALGAGNVAPNPMVGAVLVYQNRIIGEGYHKVFGGPHAELACINSVKGEDRGLIPKAAMYVSLEPCAHFGKTPPCADLIIANKVASVTVGCTDPFALVAGRGIEKLKAAGIAVQHGVLGEACIFFNRRFFTFHIKQRPFVILKWAQTANGKMSGSGEDRLKISNTFSDRIVHRWRGEEAAILVGTNTAATDDPALTTRLAPSKNPLRIVIDKDLRLPTSLQLFDGAAPTIVFNSVRSAEENKISYIKIERSDAFLQQMLTALYHLQIQSLIVEGGAALLQSFIDLAIWDEARVITSNSVFADEGLNAPAIRNAKLFATENFGSDTIRYYKQ